MSKPTFIPKPLTDGVFKHLFGNKRNIRFTEYLLECLLNLNVGSLKNRIVIKTGLKLDKQGLYKHGFETDIIVVLDEKYVFNLEAYTSFTEYGVYKSFSYLNTMFTNQFELGDDLTETKKFIQYNIVKESKYDTKDYGMISRDAERLELFEDKRVFLFKIINISKDNSNYSKESQRLFKFLGSNNMDEAKKNSEGDEILMEMYQEANKFIRNNCNNLEVIDKLYYEGMKKLARNEGINEGISRGLSQGLHTVASNMLRSGSTKEYVCEVTGLTEKEIEAIKL